MSLFEKDDWVERLNSTGEVKERAISELREVLMSGLSKSLRNRYANRVQADDVVQDALIRILGKLDTFEGRSKFTTWAMTIAVRSGMSEMRRRHFKDISIESLLGDGMRFEPAAVEASNDDLEKSDLLVKLRELVETTLTDKQRDAVHALLHGMPVEIFAEKTGSNRNAVYKLVHDARVKLRHGFEQAGYKAEDITAVFA